MEEFIPFILGASLGAVFGFRTKRYYRTVINAACVLLSGIAATVLSGEYHASWMYLLLDLGEASLGLVITMAVAARLLVPSTAVRPNAGSETKP
jgi:hypothetical protein